MLRSWLLVLAACGGGGDDLDASGQGACSNLDLDACSANTACQPSFIESGFSPFEFFHCLASEGDVMLSSCPADRDGCRSTKNCSPVFLLHLGPTDAPVGDPTYERCDLTVTLAGMVE